MRFSLRELLLVFPAFCVAASIVQVSNGVVCIVPRHSLSWSSVRSAQSQLDYLRSTGRYTPTAQEVEGWLAGQPIPRRAGVIFFRTTVDVWGNRLRCVGDVKGPDGEAVPLGVYSCGADGISQSNGYDADDLRGWDESSLSFYHQQFSEEQRIGFFIQSCFLTPVVYGVLWLCLGGFRKL
jgi:hypothetical protein